MKKQIFDRPSEFIKEASFVSIKIKDLDLLSIFKGFSIRMENLKALVLEKLSHIESESKFHVQKFLEIYAEAAAEKAVERRKGIFSRGKWVGDDFGSPENPVINIHSRGEAFGLRLENSHGLPESSGKNKGRVLFNMLDNSVHMDVGSKFKRISSNKIEAWLVNQKGQVTLDVSEVSNASNTIWQVKDASNEDQIIHCPIKSPNAKTLIIELPDAVSTYRVLGIE